MTPIAIVTGAEGRELSLRLRDQLRERGMSCVLLVEKNGVQHDTGVTVAACGALAAAGISSVVHVDPARAAGLTTALEGALSRVMLAESSADATLDCQARGWLPEPDEVYTAEELEAVTARLQELGYA